MSFFKFGDKVEMTEEAIRIGLPSGSFNNDQPTTGVIVEDQNGNFIKVKRDRRKIPNSFHAKYWRLAL